MPTPADRTKKKKFRKGTSGKSKPYFVREKPAKHKCALCNSVLKGVPHGKTKAEISKLSKTERRPSVPFGGILCSKCRTMVIEEAAKVSQKIKELNEVDLSLHKYVKQMMARVK